MFLAVFLPALMGALATAMASLVWRAVIALGIGFVTYKGLDVAIGYMQQAVFDRVNSIPGDALSLIGYLWLDKAITIIFSAVSISLAMKLLSGSLKKVQLK
ncbi:DUF2523 family protein [Collimonas fungivorans]|uniref:DUF2523 family protein n=1 Tax=Collimonas fungivorans TaxID=158899 RepID=UPI0005A0C13A|nr:DUF2523 family protein [Collimonas fungivorans]